ncbi:hypothetical protein OSTOST_07208 [Ostertagia ostertagi]
MRRVRRYPPGPFPLPLIGNLHHIIIGNIKYGGIVELMKKWQKEYGDVITFWFGPIPTVHILDFETAKEEMIVNGAAYVDRYTPYVLNIKREGRGTVFSSGDFWADHRRFSLRTLRDFALKRNLMEQRVMDEFHQKSENAAEFFEVKHALDKEILSVTAFWYVAGKVDAQLTIIQKQVEKAYRNLKRNFWSFFRKGSNRERKISHRVSILWMEMVMILLTPFDKNGERPEEKDDIQPNRTRTIILNEDGSLVIRASNGPLNSILDDMKEGGKALEQRIIPFGIGKRSCIAPAAVATSTAAEISPPAEAGAAGPVVPALEGKGMTRFVTATPSTTLTDSSDTFNEDDLEKCGNVIYSDCDFNVLKTKNSASASFFLLEDHSECNLQSAFTLRRTSTERLLTLDITNEAAGTLP